MKADKMEASVSVRWLCELRAGAPELQRRPSAQTSSLR